MQECKVTYHVDHEIETDSSLISQLEIFHAVWAILDHSLTNDPEHKYPHPHLLKHQLQMPVN